jgi:hypothetical protein
MLRRLFREDPVTPGLVPRNLDRYVRFESTGVQGG